MTLKTKKSLSINIPSYKKDETVEKKFKCGDIMILGHNFVKKTTSFH